MAPAENICSLCMRAYEKFHHLKDSISAPNELRSEGDADLQAVLEKILNKNREHRRASNEVCQNCRDKLYGIYSFSHQHAESEKIFHQITDVTVRLKKLKTFFILTDLKIEFGAIAETDKDMDSLECSSTVADIKCDDSVVSKLVVKNEFGNNFEGTDFSELSKDLSFGLFEGEYPNAADGRSVQQKKVDSICKANSKQITIVEEIVKEEWTMQEGEIFEAKAKRDVLGREQTKFSCDVCDEVFSTISCLSEHTKIVHENDSHDFKQADAGHNNKKEEHTQRFDTMKKFACDRCDAKYKNRGGLWAHRKRAHCVALSECDMCDAELKNKTSLEKHKLSHTSELLDCKYYCCNKKFTTKASLRHHRLSRICESLKCVQCDVKLSNKKCLRQHLKMVHSITNYSCDQCERKFKYKYRLREHKQWHAGVVFKCDHCDAKFKTKASLRQHKMVHAGIRFACNQCDASLSSKGNLAKHLQTVHTDVVFSCDHCDATYKNKRAFNEHKQMHNGILFNCDQCDVKYKSRTGLSVHKVSHAGIKFACNQCDASLSTKGSLKIHQRTVHTDAVFSCEHCGVTYKSKQAFNDHKQMHNGILFSCDQCDAIYKTNAGLRLHKMSHAGIKFACNQCDASLSTKGSLKIHQRTAHTGAVFSCEHCDATCKNQRALNTHKLSQHTSQEYFKLYMRSLSGIL